MSAGSPIVNLRIRQTDLDQIDAAVQSANVNRRAEPYTRSSWIMAAILDKLDHLARSQRTTAKRKRLWQSIFAPAPYVESPHELQNQTRPTT